MRLIYFLSISLVLSLLACSTAKQINEDEVPDFSYLEPISYIYFVDKTGNEVLDDSLSIINRNLLDDMMSTYSDNRIYIASDSIHYLTLSIIENITEQALQGIEPTAIKVPSSLHPILDQSNTKYTVGILSDGFVLDKKRYRNEILWSGLFADEFGDSTLPAKHAAHIYCVILDNEDKDVVSFEPIHYDYGSPTKPKVITKQINALVKRLNRNL